MTHAEKTALSYYQQMDKACPTVAQYSRNLNLLYLQGLLDGCYYREDIITQIQKILMRKVKANVLLTGVAGCGKTALVEGTAAQITQRKINYEQVCDRERKKYRAMLRADGAYADVDSEEDDFVAPPKPPLCDCVIYDLSLTALVGGTKYRGEFEERLQNVIDECRGHPSIVLFVDEAHLLTSVGKSEASDSSAQMLKPALARNDIRMIGATTNEEKVHICKDKALWRRFCEIVVTPLSGEAAQKTAVHILNDYCRFHGIITDASAEELWKLVQQQLPHSVFPDNLINVIDETLASAVFDGRYAVGMVQFQQVLERLVENASKKFE
jgi:ATP-dependent Clp protease ATP-binding subunit ClpC